jgi:hypothetical protein
LAAKASNNPLALAVIPTYPLSKLEMPNALPCG